METATQRLIRLASALNPSGEIGDGMVAQLNEAARAAQAEQPSPLSPAQLNYAANRFLSWRLPDNFSPDCFIRFEPPTPRAPFQWPTGTNLIGATEAREMVEFITRGLPPA